MAYQGNAIHFQIQKTHPSITDRDRKSHRTEDSTHPDTIGEMPWRWTWCRPPPCLFHRQSDVPVHPPTMSRPCQLSPHPNRMSSSTSAHAGQTITDEHLGNPATSPPARTSTPTPFIPDGDTAKNVHPTHFFLVPANQPLTAHPRPIQAPPSESPVHPDPLRRSRNTACCPPLSPLPPVPR